MTWGKHEGKRVSEVPRSYLRWLNKNRSGLPADLREAIERAGPAQPLDSRPRYESKGRGEVSNAKGRVTGNLLPNPVFL